MSDYSDLFMELKKDAEKTRRKSFYVYVFVVMVAFSFLLFMYISADRKYAELSSMYVESMKSVVEADLKISSALNGIDELSYELSNSRNELSALVNDTKSKLQQYSFQRVNDMEDRVLAGGYKLDDVQKSIASILERLEVIESKLATN